MTQQDQNALKKLKRKYPELSRVGNNNKQQDQRRQKIMMSTEDYELYLKLTNQKGELMSKKKEYIFSNTFTVTEETEVLANSYEEAVDIFLSGGGTTDEVDTSGGNWECIQEPLDDEEQE